MEISPERRTPHGATAHAARRTPPTRACPPAPEDRSTDDDIASTLDI
jgi:hypothetical protein